MTISGGRNEQLVIIAGFLPCHWLYEWFSQFHSCGTYSVHSWSPSISVSYVNYYIIIITMKSNKLVAYSRHHLHQFLWQCHFIHLCLLKTILNIYNLDNSKVHIHSQTQKLHTVKLTCTLYMYVFLIILWHLYRQIIWLVDINRCSSAT